MISTRTLVRSLAIALSLVTASITVTAVINAMPSFYTYTRQEKHSSKSVIHNLQWILAETLIVLNLAIGIIVIVSEKPLNRFSRVEIKLSACRAEPARGRRRPCPSCRERRLQGTGIRADDARRATARGERHSD